MIGLCVLLLAFSGFAALCAAMGKHQSALLGRTLSPRGGGALRNGGVAILAAAFILAVADQGAGFGSVYWTGAIMLSALALTLLIPYRPSWARPAGVVAAGLAAILAGGHLLMIWRT
ncbi:MAG TPA: DUF3325 domain-containing protein [Phenylobacterium sp.]|nr:DUF3325 domain-containing protein [Phenylobacterium sp.]